MAFVSLLALTVAACSSGGDGDSSGPSAVTSAPIPTAAATAGRPAPAATPTSLAQSITEPSALSFTTEILSLDYTTDWRISNRSEDSVTYTLKERPGEVLFSVQWTPGSTPDSLDAFADRLDLLAAEVVRLEDIEVAGHAARRYFSLFLDGDEPSNLVLNVIANVGGTTYLITFAAPPELFQEHATKAEEFIGRLRFP